MVKFRQIYNLCYQCMQIIDYKQPDAAKLFVSSLRETGFGVLENHPLDMELVKTIYSEWQLFFNSDEKNQYLFDAEKHDGYFPPEQAESAKGYEQRDIKEYFHIYPWGRIPEHLKENVMNYYQQASHFAAEILSWVEQYSPEEISRGFSEPLSKMIENTPNTLLRVLHYPPLKGNEHHQAIRAAAHEDINLLTILPASNEPGLQVKKTNGKWLDVPCNFGNLIINIGDMLQEVTQGYFPSTPHRVLNPQNPDHNRSRISLPLFLHPRDEVRLSRRHTQKSYLQERLRELGYAR